MIEAEDLTRYYGNFAAVRDATFSIGEREIVGFLGLNGAGKSTILKILAGLLMPSSGRVTVGGIDAMDAPDALRRRIGFLPEEPPLYREMRVADFLHWAGQVKGRSGAQIEADLPSVLERCQLLDVQHKVIAELSHGYRKRVGIAQAIIHRPDVVILDEPISGLDPKQIVEMRQVVRSLKESATVLISSHILSEIALTCDRVLVIHQGRIVAEGSEDELSRTAARAEVSDSPKGGQIVELQLRGARAQIDEALAAHSGVERIDFAASEGELHRVVVHLSADSREELVRGLVEARVGVRSVADAVSDLERSFLALTQGQTPASGPAKASPPKPSEANKEMQL